MLLRFCGLGELDMRRFLDIYEESTRENCEIFFPEDEPEAALIKGEAAFRDYLAEFFAEPGNTCWVLEEDGIWVSALRLSLIEEGFYYLEALETRPDSRMKGYASKLIGEVVGRLKELGPFRICDCVSKRNIPSIKTHLGCGFTIVSDEGHDHLTGESCVGCYGFEFRYEAPEKA